MLITIKTSLDNLKETGLLLSLGGEMERCPRCLRYHNPPLCSIPPRQTRIQTGLRTGFFTTQDYEIEAPKFRVRVSKPKRSILPGLLDYSLELKSRCEEMLKVLPPELDEYQKLVEKADQLDRLIGQVKVQMYHRGIG